MVKKKHFLKSYNYSSPPLATGDMFQDPSWMPETTDSTEPYTYYVFSSTYTPCHSKEALRVSLWHVQIASITTLVLWGHY